MNKPLLALLALALSSTAFAAPALAAARDSQPGVFGAPVQIADRDDNNDGEDNNQGCYNPAGHRRGRCGNNSRNYQGGYNNQNYTRINGSVLNIQNGYVATFRRADGQTILVNERALLRAGTPLQPGGRYSLTGYFASNGMFVVANNTYTSAYPNNGQYPYPDNGQYPYPNNGYPNHGNANVSGVVTSIHGNSVTLLQGQFQTITINDQQALNNGAAQNLYVGRSVNAYGYWSGNVFYAGSIG